MILSFEFQGIEDLQLYSFFHIVLAIIGPFHFHVNFRIILSISSKKPAGVLIVMVLNL